MTLATDFLKEHGLDYRQMMDRHNTFSYWERLGGAEKFMEIIKLRTLYIQKFGFAILTDEAIEALRVLNPFVEVGCGSGYWAYELRKAGIDVIPTEPYPERKGAYADADWKMFVEAEKLSGPAAVLKYPERTLLTVWPDYKKSWSALTLKAYKGKTVVYVGESAGGCTGNGEFHDILERDFVEGDSIDIPQFSGIHDYIQVWRRK